MKDSAINVKILKHVEAKLEPKVASHISKSLSGLSIKIEVEGLKIKEEIWKNLDSQLTSVVCKIIDDPATEMMIQKKISSQIDVKLQEK